MQSWEYILRSVLSNLFATIDGIYLRNVHGFVARQGNEGVDVKMGSVGTIIKDNEIHMQLDDESGGQLEWGSLKRLFSRKVRQTGPVRSAWHEIEMFDSLPSRSPTAHICSTRRSTYGLVLRA